MIRQTLTLLVLAILFSPVGMRAQQTWRQVAAPTANNLWSVAAGGGTFIAVGENGTILSSADGLAWTQQESGTTAWLVGVAFGDGHFTAVGDHGTILTPTDGVGWTPRTSGTTQRLNGVARGVDRWLAVGEASTVLSSVDGVTWTVAPESKDSWFPVPAGWLHGLCFGYGQFVATGQHGNIATTADAVWLQDRSVPTAANLEGVTYGRHQFVAVADDGVVLTSADGVEWRGHAVPKPLRALTVFNEQYVAAASDGTIATSPDAIAWTVRPTNNTQMLTAVAGGPGVVVAVGVAGTILRSTAESVRPSLVSAPADRQDTIGSTVALRVLADGGGPFSYQWTHDDQPMAGATTDTLVLPSATTADAGVYRATVSNGAGSITSAPAHLEIVPAADIPLVTYPAPAAFDGTHPTALVSGGNGRMLVGSSGSVRRITADNQLDPTFAADGVLPTIDVLVRQSDGRILVGGATDSHTAAVLRLNDDGSRDATFAAAALPGATVSSIAVQADGKILLATNTSRLVRLNADGSNDASFASADLASYATGDEGTPRIRRVALAPDQRIVVAAQPTTTLYDGTHHVIVARLLASGALDPTFTPRHVGAMVPEFLFVQPDQRVVLVSYFDANGFFGSWWQLERLQADGRADLSFVTHRDSFAKYGGQVRVARDVAGRIVTVLGAGAFYSITVHRYGPDGDLDTTLRGTWPASRYPLVAAATDDAGRIWTSSQSSFFYFPATNAPIIQPPLALDEEPSVIEQDAGAPLTIRSTAAGTAPLRFDQEVVFEDRSYAVATPATPEITLSSVYQNGTLVVTVSNPAGAVALPPRRIHVRPAAPQLLTVPSDATIPAGRIVELSFVARGSGPLTYEWWFNGTLYRSGTLRPTAGPGDGTGDAGTLTLYPMDETHAGSYQLVLTNSAGTVRSAPIAVTIEQTARLANVSTRGYVGTGDATLIAGFVIAGNAPKWVMLRGVGPGLATYGVTDFLADPQLTLFNARGEVIGGNDDWDADGFELSTFHGASLGGLVAGSKDAMIVQRLAPGSYSVQVSGKAGATGIALAEVYESTQDAARLVNLSSRVQVGTGDRVGIAGFSLTGDKPRTVLIRAIGPTLGAFGVAGVPSDPTLAVVEGNGTPISGNGDWSSSTDADAIAAASVKVGAFPVPRGSKDAAVLVTLRAGTYCALVSGADTAPGIALVEVYEVP